MQPAGAHHPHVPEAFPISESDPELVEGRQAVGGAELADVAVESLGALEEVAVANSFRSFLKNRKSRIRRT